MLPLLAVPATLFVVGGADAAAPPTIPDGYVELVDDTGLLTVVVPDTWTEVDTVPATIPPIRAAVPNSVAVLPLIDEK